MTALAPIAQTQSRAGDESAPRPSRWSDVFAITRCVFTLNDSESMPVDLPTPLARDPHVGEGLMGGGVAVSGACAVLRGSGSTGAPQPS